VGGVSTIDAKTAAEIVRLLNPKIVIPMHYQTDVTSWLEPLEKFTTGMGLREVVPQPKLTVTKSNVPPETKVVILDYRSK
jgi:L-ascorbate metabolism protein UlaG (beta-lactamase superfamily)